MIDEKKLIEDLFYKMPNNFGAQAIEWFRDLIQEQPKIGEWIPCSERLPEVFDNVLVCTKEGGRAIAHRCPNQAVGHYYDLHSSTIENVIAWQPLPEAYHE